MKIKREFENESELLDVLVNKDVVMEIRVVGEIQFELKSSDEYSLEGLSQFQVLKMIEQAFYTLGAVVHVE